MADESRYQIMETLTPPDKEAIVAFIEQFPQFKSELTTEYEAITEKYILAQTHLLKLGGLTTSVTGKNVMYFYYELEENKKVELLSSFNELTKARNDYIYFLQLIMEHAESMQEPNEYLEKQEKKLQELKGYFLKAYENFSANEKYIKEVSN